MMLCFNRKRFILSNPIRDFYAKNRLWRRRITFYIQVTQSSWFETYLVGKWESNFDIFFRCQKCFKTFHLKPHKSPLEMVIEKIRGFCRAATIKHVRTIVVSLEHKFSVVVSRPNDKRTPFFFKVFSSHVVITNSTITREGRSVFCVRIRRKTVCIQIRLRRRCNLAPVEVAEPNILVFYQKASNFLDSRGIFN